MFTSSTTAAPQSVPTETSPAPAASTSPTRTGRLRGLSYLRNYTQAHLGLSSTRSTSRGHLRRSSTTPVLIGSAAVEDDVRPNDTNSAPASDSETPRGRIHGRASTSRGSGLTASQPGSQRRDSPAAGTDRPANAGMPRERSRAARFRSLRNNIESATGTGGRDRSTPTENGTASASANIEGATTETASAPEQAAVATPEQKPEQLPSLRLVPQQDLNGGRPSLVFNPISRTLPNPTSIIRVGRYSERDNSSDVPDNVPSAAPVGFKSKVVSRRHCEFYYSSGQWFIKDVKSSSGTFLNHIRLSQPGSESRPYAIKDGDIVQLGIDFRGGEEMIFRCVKIKVECNRGWQKGLNPFNKTTHQRIRNLAKNQANGGTSAPATTTSSECSICLNRIAPCQSLFVAPCSHVWHFKCVRRMLNDTRQYPHFTCPNCRATADLEADVDEPQEVEEEEWEQLVDDTIEQPKTNGVGSDEAPSAEAPNGISIDTEAANEVANELSTRNMINLTLHDVTIAQRSESVATVAKTAPARPTGSQPIDIAGNSHPVSPSPINNLLFSPTTQAGSPGPTPSRAQFALASLDITSPDGPMTPRNDVGPFILDGSAGRAEQAPSSLNRSTRDTSRRLTMVASLDPTALAGEGSRADGMGTSGDESERTGTTVHAAGEIE